MASAEPIQTEYNISTSGYPSELLATLSRMQQTGEGTDVVLESGDQSVSCHRAVLAAASPYLRNIFASDTEESVQGILDLGCIDSSVLQSVVTYMYSGNCYVDMTNLSHMVQATDTLLLPTLKSSCDNFMAKEVDDHNCIQLYSIGGSLKLDKIREQAKILILNNFDTFIKAKDFGDLIFEDLQEIVCSDDLNIEKEDVVFDTVTSWYEMNKESRHDDAMKLMQHVRFPYCSANYLSYTVYDHSLMQNTEGCKLLKEARIFQMNVHRQNELVSPRTVPRRCFGVKEQLVLIGGYEKEGFFLKDDLTKWEDLPDLPEEGDDYGACVVPFGIVVTGLGSSGKCSVLRKGINKWEDYPSLLTGRHRHASIYHDEFLYVFGGYGYVTSVESCNIVELEWKNSVPLPEGLELPLAVSNGPFIYVLGGETKDHVSSKKLYAFHPSWRTWEEKHSMPDACLYSAAVSLNDKIFVVGGQNACCMSFDTMTNTWSILVKPAMPHARVLAGIVVWHGKILLDGGEDEDCNSTDAIEEYDPAMNQWTTWTLRLKYPVSCHFVFNIKIKSW